MLDDYPIILVSSRNKVYLKKNAIICNSPKSALEKISELGFEKVFLSGGLSLNASFINAGLVEEIIINYNPVFIVNGKSFTSDLKKDLKVNIIKQ